MPWVVRWPAVAKSAGVRCETPVIVEDLFPTFLEGARLRAEFSEPLHGRSMLPLLREPAATLPGRALFWHYPNVWGPKGPGIHCHSSIRRGDWKLVYDHQYRSYELYNLAEDLGETWNRAASEEAKVAELAAELGAFLAKEGAQMPRTKEGGEVVPYPGS